MIHLALLAYSVAAGCTARGLLPDPACTPGAMALVERAAVCGSSSRSRRHVSSLTRRLVLVSYGVAPADAHLYELDHLVPLELGGSNDPDNLWPEPIEQARLKDHAENAARRRVCGLRPTETLTQAQQGFATDWTKE